MPSSIIVVITIFVVSVGANVVIVIIVISNTIIAIMPMPSCLQDVVLEMLILRHVQKRKLRRHIKRHITEMSAAHLTGTRQSQFILDRLDLRHTFPRIH